LAKNVTKVVSLSSSEGFLVAHVFCQWEADLEISNNGKGVC